MTILVDTGVLYADHDTDASRHDSATAAIESVYDGTFGASYISDYIYDETVTLALRRTGSHTAAATLGKLLRGAGRFPRTYEMVDVSTSVFTDAVDVFERYDDQRLSFTDATTVAVAERYGIDSVLSFDDDFDGLVDRVDPSEL